MFLKIDESDWTDIKKAFSEVSMSLSSHQNVLNILNFIENKYKQEAE